MKTNYLFFLLSFLTAFYAQGQEKTKVAGVVTDVSFNNEPMPSVSIMIEGTRQGTNTDVEGRYTLELNSGTHILIFSYIGYETYRDTINLQAGQNLTLDVALSTTSNLLNDVVITEEVRQDTESALLRRQLNAAVTRENIGSQEMSRKGISNAETALTKVAGISKQEGTSGLFVRGLGDRYNITFLNGLPLPSNEPTSKNVALNLFGTDVIQSIEISKIYTAENFGDMGGASVNIQSKEHVGKPNLQVNLGTGLNTQAVGASDFKQASHLRKSGFYNIEPPRTLDQYVYTSSWSPGSTSMPYNLNLGLSGGGSFNLGTGSLSIFANLAFENDYVYRTGSERIMGISQNIVNADYFNIDRYAYTSHTTASFNAKYRLNSRNSLRFNSVFINGASSTVSEFDYKREDTNPQFSRQTLTVQNQLWLNQLLGEHQLSDRYELEWGASYGRVNADMPDRITNVLTLRNDGSGYIYSTGILSDQNRFYQYINEDELSGRAALKYRVFHNEQDKYNGSLTLGYTGKIKKRDFEATQFNTNIQGVTSAHINNIDDYLNAGNFNPNAQPNSGQFRITTLRGARNIIPQTYSVNQSLHGGYLVLEHDYNSTVTYTLGLRADKVLQTMEWNTSYNPPNISFDDATIDRFFFLPELTLRYKLSAQQNLRFAVSKSYTLPQFLEQAPFQYEDVTFQSVGNAAVNPSDNYNLDLKWEAFPSRNELVSFGVFGKYISNPISQTLLAAASNNLFSYVNAGDFAYVLGAEMDVRKELFNNFSAGLNLTYMYTRQELNPAKVSEETSNSMSVNFNTDRDGLQGASPLLVNVDLTYKLEGGRFSPTLAIVGNYFSDRIFSLGSFGRGNIIEKGYPIIGFVGSVPFGDRWQLGLKVNNITNSQMRMVQDNSDLPVEVFSYRRGVDFNLGLKYNIL